MSDSQLVEFLRCQVKFLRQVIETQHETLENATNRKWTYPPSFDFKE